MNYFLDCEFNGFGGELLSMALVREDGRSLYIVLPANDLSADIDPWVCKNVLPLMDKAPPEAPPCYLPRGKEHKALQGFFAEDPRPHIIADWPDDIRYLCWSLLTGPGQMIRVPRMSFEIIRVDAYPTLLEGAVQHNAWWDAMALRHKLLNLTSPTWR